MMGQQPDTIFTKESYHQANNNSPKRFEVGSTSYVVDKTDFESVQICECHWQRSQTWWTTMMKVKRKEGVTTTSV